MEGAILTAEAEVDSKIRAPLTVRVDSAWGALGHRGRALTVGGGVAVVATAVVWTAATISALAAGLSLLVLVVAAMVDAVEHRLPNPLVGAAAIPVIVAMAAAWVTGAGAITTGAAVGAALVGAPLLVTHLVSPTGMGFGDVKAGAVLGGALGLINAEIAVLALVLGLSGAATWALAGRRRTIALGPGLVAGALIALAVAQVLHVEAAG